MSPRFLLIETSQQPGFVAIAEGESLIGVRWLDEARRHARDLVPLIGELFKDAAWQPRDIATVLVSLGPGSYTGLRVGIMSAKTFAYATQCSLVGVETFQIIAAQSPQESGRIAVIADAQQERVYVQEFEGMQAITGLLIQPFRQWLVEIASPMCVSGPGLAKWASHLPPHLKMVDPSCWNPQPEALLQLGLERHQRKEWTDFWSVEPIYLRPSAAEEQLANRSPRA